MKLFLLFIPTIIGCEVEWNKLGQPLWWLELHSTELVLAVEVWHFARFEVTLELLLRFCRFHGILLLEWATSSLKVKFYEFYLFLLLLTFAFDFKAFVIGHCLSFKSSFNQLMIALILLFFLASLVCFQVKGGQHDSVLSHILFAAGVTVCTFISLLKFWFIKASSFEASPLHLL